MQVPAQPMHWKDRAIEKAETITDLWEVGKTYAARSADIILFVCLVMNIVQILPGVKLWPFVINIVIGVQAITLDIAGVGLADMARRARANGDEKAAGQAKGTSVFLIGLMMVTVTLITSGNLWTEIKIYTDMADKALILVRVAATVWYGVVVHNLRHNQTASAQNLPPDLDQILSEMRTQIQQELASSLSSLRNDLSAQIDAKVITPEPLDYSEIAREMMPVFSQITASLQEEIESKIVAQMPAIDPINYDAMAASIMPAVEARISEIEASISARIPAPVNYDELALQLAPLVQACNKDETPDSASGEMVSETNDDTPQPRITAKLTDLPVQQTRNTDNLKIVSRPLRKSSTEVSEAATKMRRIVKRNPAIKPTELATKAGVSRSTASRFLKTVSTVA